MDRRFLALWLPCLQLDRHARDEAAAAGAWPTSDAAQMPRVVAVRQGGALRLTAVDARASAAGLFPGLSLADARARLPNIRIVADDPAADGRFLEKLARWAERYTPDVALDPPDGLLLDITGAAHLHGGEAGLRRDALARLERGRVTARAAIADTAAAAWALARFGRPAAAGHPDAPHAGESDAMILGGDDAERVLDTLPCAALRLDAAVLDQLERLGLRRIGDLRRMPRRGLVARFGEAIAQRLDALSGQRDVPISPLSPACDWAVRRAFPDPISTPEDIARLADGMLVALCSRLAAAERGARAIELRCRCLDGRIERCGIATAAPVATPARLMKLLSERLGHLRPGLGIESAELIATRVEALAPSQRSLGAGLGTADRAPDLAPLVDALSNRLGAQAVGRLVPVARHVPEAAQHLLPALAPIDAGIADEAASWRTPWADAAARPLRLLEMPVPLDVTAEVPDGPPLQFRLHGRLHRVRAADGPERIAPEWWHGQDGRDRPQDWLRDYYRVEDRDGGRFWVFRRLAQGGAQRGATRDWFLHGVFA
jgi:protein ImuB